jgi:hypothetical protein
MAQDNKVEKSTIGIRSELYEELMKEAEEKLHNMKDHVENIIDRHLNRNKMISKMWPGLQIVKFDENTIVVVNINDRKFFDVKLHDNYMLCEQDKSAGCEHVAFVWMQAEDLELDNKF